MTELKSLILTGLTNKPSRSLGNVALELDVSQTEALAALRELEREGKVQMIAGNRWRISAQEEDPQ